MKKHILGTLVLLIILVQSCVPSLHPIYTKDTIVKNQLLEGKFLVGEKEYWIFKKTEKAYYQGFYYSDEKTSEFEVHLVELGEQLYLDFFPVSSGFKDENDFWISHLVPAHTFAKVTLRKDGLSMQMFNDEWLSDQIKNRYIRIKHEVTNEDQIVITAPTEELQKFIIKYANHSNGEETAFMEGEFWKRANK